MNKITGSLGHEETHSASLARQQESGSLVPSKCEIFFSSKLIAHAPDTFLDMLGSLQNAKLLATCGVYKPKPQ